MSSGRDLAPVSTLNFGLKTPRRILVRGVNWLGDAVMTTPALQRLRERFPDAFIAVTTLEKLRDLWLHHPAVDQIISLPAGLSPWAVGKRIRAFSPDAGPAFDLALVLPNSPRSAIEVWFAGVPCRIGYARSWRNWLLTHPVGNRPGHVPMRKLSASEVRRRTEDSGASSHTELKVGPESHQMYEYLHLAGAAGADVTPIAPQIAVSAEEVSAAAALLAGVQTAAPETMWLAVNPAAAFGPAKRWPAENFAAVLRVVSGHFPNAGWLLLGTEADRGLCATIAEQSGVNVVNLAGKTSLRQLVGLLKLSRLLLTNDSGPMHLAAALGTPVVAIFGSTSPELTGPGLPGDSRHRLLRVATPCAPCYRRTCPIDLRCLTGIRVDEVVAVMKQMLSEPFITKGSLPRELKENGVQQT